jgi:SAM-dependent methyltransferase
MQDPDYAIGVVHRHLAALGDLPKPFRSMELGPGDSPYGALIAAASGSAETWLVDVAPFARYRADTREVLHHRLRTLGLDPPGPSRIASFDEYLQRLGAHYLTDGVRSISSIPSGHLHVIWSHAVLEHVRRDDFPVLMRELHRVLAPGGAMSHRVDLLDHLDGGFNNLRFSSSLWERPVVWRSGAYTNRLGRDEMVDAMTAAGFDVAVTETTVRPVPGRIRRTLAPEFRARSGSQLAVAGFDVVAHVQA